MTRTLQYYKVYNCFPSFVSTFTQNGVETPNPLPNYGSMGDHLQDYFDNRMGETPAGGVGNLVAFLGSEKSLTSIHQDSLTGMANKLSTSYGITTGTVGYALLDFRGDSWKYLVGDGIIGPSNITNSPIYNSVKSSAVSILNHFNNQYPNIKWAYAGLPNIPQFTTFAPTAGSSFSWSPSLTNSGITNSHWDASHPTGGSAYGDVFTDWEHTPTELKTFYKNQTINRVKDILDVSGWMCPDINPTISHSTEFGRVMFPLVGKHMHTDAVVLAASTYAFSQNREFHVMPLVCTLYRSRESHVFDSMMTGSNAYFTNGTYVAGAVASGTTASSVALEVLNGFTANQSDAADMVISRFTLRAGMLEPAALAGADGFIYQDQMPILIDLACTGATQQTDDRMTQAIDRARNFISNTVYGTSNTDTIPWTTVAEEVKGNISYGIMAELLTTISESIPVGDPMWGVLALENGVNTPNESVGITAYDSIFWESNSQSTEPQQFYTSSEFLATCPCPPTDRGACCKDDACADNVAISVCTAQGGTFHKDQPCSAFSDLAGCAPFCNCCGRKGCLGYLSERICNGIEGAGCVSNQLRDNDVCAPVDDTHGPSNCCNNKKICVYTIQGPTPECPGGKTCIRYYLSQNSCWCKDTDGNGQIDPDLFVQPVTFTCYTDCPSTCVPYQSIDSDLFSCMRPLPGCQDSTKNIRVPFCPLSGCPSPTDPRAFVLDSCNGGNQTQGLIGGETPSEEQQLTNFLNSLDEETRLLVIYTLTNVYGYDIIYANSLTEKLTTVNSVTQTFRKKSIVINTLVDHMRFFPNQNLSYMNLIGNYAVGEVGGEDNGYDHNIVARIQSEFAFDRFLLPNSYT